MNDETPIEAIKTSGDLVPQLKDLRAVKAAAEAINIPVEDFADRFGNLSVMFRKLTEDDKNLPLKDLDPVIHRLSVALKMQDVKHKSPEDACICGLALGWAFAGYVATDVQWRDRA